ncbi:galactinol--sucrose galactosyltransferase-like [Hibiscus syriacus]|uniref:galactinol--sucrose galactosyltransferase-like n=1 Tax=Hibiscus syriacus TaxID=106335 RepID=UPI00192055A7|nr:galactinol--sucrose galactosyltransferase-like [Hibiscus syriacus]
MEGLAVDKIFNTGIGLVPPEKADELYEGLHSHLENVGIDGVKVDVIHLLEMSCENYGGRVELAKAYFKALTDSVRKHFKGTALLPVWNTAMVLCFLEQKPFVSVASVTLTAHFGSKDVTWFTVLTTVYGWATLFTLTGTCSNPLTLVPSSMLLQGPSPVARLL